jgi:amidase
MPVTPPTSGELARIAERYGLHLPPQDLESFRVLAAGLLASYDEVERLYATGAPEPPQRRYQWPQDGGNDLGAWYVSTDITTRRDGPRRPAPTGLTRASAPPRRRRTTCPPWTPA